MKLERYFTIVCILAVTCCFTVGCEKMQTPMMDAMEMVTEPETPMEPETPTETETPMEPETPTETETPMEPETPTETETPMEPEMPTTYPELVKVGLFYQAETVEHVINSQVYKDFLAAPCLSETGRPRSLPLEFPTYEEAERMIAYLNDAEGVESSHQRPVSSEVHQYFNGVSIVRICE